MSEDSSNEEHRRAPTISKSLEIVLNLAVKEATDRRHEYLTVEHVLYALLFDERTKEIVRSCGGSVAKLRAEIIRHFDEEFAGQKLADDQLPNPTVAFQRSLQRAAHNVFAAGKDLIQGENLLIAIYSEPESFAVFFLEQQGVGRLDVLRFVSHGISRVPATSREDRALESPNESSQAEPEKTTENPKEEKTDSEPAQKDPLELYAVNLCTRARQGKIDPLIGRDAELERTVHVLMRRRKNNPLYVGDPGVGKTAIAEGLARRIVEQKVPEPLRTAEIFSLDLGAMLAGSKFRGDFEERIKSVLKSLQKIPNGILFIDEIHNLVGAGAVSGGTMDAANLLKPLLASGEVRCIGSTTYKEFRNHFENDQALSRRFQKIDVNEPTINDTVKILDGLKSTYEQFHKVQYGKDALRSAVELSARYITDRKLPDKAIDVIDEAAAALALKRVAAKNKTPTVTTAMIEATVSRMARVPVERVSHTERESLKNLDGDLKGSVFGQDDAITAVVKSIRLSKAGLTVPDKPIGSFLFTGPTGVGKTEVAKQLAKKLGIEFIRFDMSEYMEKHSVSRLIGAPPGYVGFDQGGLLTEAIIKSPHAVLLLDEIEKAHPDLHNILLQVMDHGTLTDTNGRKADFRNVVIIMTTNAGAEELSKGSIGFGRKPGETEGVSQAVKNAFSPEFRNRLNAIVSFAPLKMEIVESIVDKFISELNEQLVGKKVKIRVTPAARAWLAKKGYEPAYGARPLHRTIEEFIKKPLADEVLFGNLTKGGTVEFDAGDEALSIRYN
jgi:ATP-dependent Clp protease ATP-binding subunit ClpA